MFDAKVLDKMYDDSLSSGLPLLHFMLFDHSVLFPRSMVLDVIRRETGQELTLAEADGLATAGLFKWLGGAGDGTELGLPMYVPSRIGLCAELLKKGWSMPDLKDFVEWEEWVVDDTLSTGLAYEEDDCALIVRAVRRDLEGINEELLARLPAADRPEGWSQMSWDSRLAAKTLPELQAERDRLLKYVDRVEKTDIATTSARWKHHLGRQAFHIRARDESVRVITILGDRKRIEAGFSPGVQFSGQRSVFPEKDRFETFGRVDWANTLSHWRFLEDPDHFPIRLPGFVLVGGKVTLDELLPAQTYEERSELFRLSEYVQLFGEIASEPRCANCSRVLKGRPKERRRYCSEHCSQAARQRTYRERQKAAILRRGREA